jgi:hypothetical protein
MRMMMRGLVMAAVLMAGVGAAGAQIIDGSTGQLVDASNDPADFALVASGQPGNIGTEISSNDFAEMQASAAADSQALMDSMNASSSSDTDDATAGPAVPVVPSTPKPAIGPKASTFVGAGQVTIADADAGATVFYTLDGTKPTENSAVYVAPIPVNGKTKVRALAWDMKDRPSGVASKTFKVKS